VAVPAAAVAEDAREERVDAQLVVTADGQFVGHSVFAIPGLIREIPYCFCNDFSIPSFSSLMEEHSFCDKL
jgi:hypothetical protein